MTDIYVNDIVWNAASDDDKNKIISHLKTHGVLQANDNFVADASTPPPGPNTPLYGATVGDVATVKTLGFDWICKAACDAAAAAAAAACSLSGPGLAACLAGIAAARSACRDGC